jgi:uncharacterized protein
MTHMIPRILEERIKNNKKSILLLGPRQVGKSTLCQSLNPDVSINLADERDYRLHVSDPGLISRIVAASKPDSLILLDEVQRIPSILNTVQVLIDQSPNRKFLITGSSARKLKRGNANLLPGRVFIERMSPLLFWELGDLFDLDRALQVGTLPEVFLKEYGARLLDSYIDGYLREEIQAEALTKDLGAYSRFLDLAAELNGHFLNYSKVSSDSEIKKETVRRYFSILEDTLLIHRVPSFTDISEKRSARQKDRFIFFDLGVRNAILQKQVSNFTLSEKGILFEQWLLLQIMSYNTLFDKRWKISSFSLLNGTSEVDIIIETASEIFAIEVKYKDKVDQKASKNLIQFEKLLGRKCEKIVVYTGDHTQLFDNGVKVIPYKVFLNEILNNTLMQE